MSGSSEATQGVAIALIWRAGRLLVQLRPRDAIEGDFWEFPGGKLMPAETPGEAARRECREELGVEIEVGPLVWTREVRHPLRNLDLFFFHARLISAAEPEPLASQALRWLKPAELLALSFCAADRELVAELAAGRIDAPPEPAVAAFAPSTKA